MQVIPKIMFVAILFTFLRLSSAIAQENRSDATTVTPTPIVFPPPTSPYPELICPYFQFLESGSSWQDIEIGVSTQTDLEIALERYGRYEIIYPTEGSLANSIRYSWSESTESGSIQQAPLHVDICMQGSVITVMEVSWTNQHPIYVEDLIVNWGVPDITVWSSLVKRRSVFWFQLGVMAEVFVQQGDADSFGRITRLIYFPRQNLEGFENRWPFTVTRMQRFNPADVSIPNEVNPFDFDSMVATITAEPSRTPTPTLMPVTTATP